jgi:hypothetical protein
MTFGRVPRPRRRSSGKPTVSTGSADRVTDASSRERRSRLGLALVFTVLLAAFAAGIWGTLLRPAAYEVRGTLIARPAANLLLVRHDEIPGLGMRSMELMAIFADPALLERAGVLPGQRVRMAVRARNDELQLVWIERLP